MIAILTDQIFVIIALSTSKKQAHLATNNLEVMR